MANRKKLVAVKDPTPEELEPVFNIETANPCNAWAFLLGPAFQVFCPLERGHEGDHEVDINIYTEPQAHFHISWALEKQ